MPHKMSHVFFCFRHFLIYFYFLRESIRNVNAGDWPSNGKASWTEFPKNRTYSIEINAARKRVKRGKETLTRDFRLLVIFIKQFPVGPCYAG
jgi:hypothetical protein